MYANNQLTINITEQKEAEIQTRVVGTEAFLSWRMFNIAESSSS